LIRRYSISSVGFGSEIAKMPAGMPLREKQIMEKLFELKKLSANDIAFVLGCNVQTVLRRKREFESNGTITAVKEMSWQKVKPEHVEVSLLLPSADPMNVTVLKTRIEDPRVCPGSGREHVAATGGKLAGRGVQPQSVYVDRQ
jgi:hypothetical protein